MQFKSRQRPGRRFLQSLRNRRPQDYRSLRQLSLETLEERRLLVGDFGDAPQPYPTLQEEDGAQHLANGPRLGELRDTEDDGQPSIQADGDDTADESDEDGVTLSLLTTGETNASLSVNVQEAPSGAQLDAWIDFDADGSWGGPGEHIADALAVVNGDNTVSFAVPSWAVDGRHMARFRLAQSGDLGFFGLAGSGEVEDHLVDITTAVPAVEVFGALQAINSNADGASDVKATDLDGDGDVDVLSASQEDGTIAWYQNDGSQGFTTQIISNTEAGATSVTTGDIDGDGDLDIVTAAATTNSVSWYENEDNEQFSVRVITNEALGANQVLIVDLDGDGDHDVLSTSSEDDSIRWYENDSTQQFTTHSVNNEAAGASGLAAADINGDGYLDLLTASSTDDSITWYANDGSQTFTAHVISDSALGASSLFTTDLDRDGDTDVIAASADDNTLWWFEYDAAAEDEGEAFVAHTVTTDALGASEVITADLDGDGDTDLLSASANDNTIAWYQNDGEQSFARHIISADSTGATAVSVADVDGDGDLDVLSASHEDDTIAWFAHNAIPTLDGINDVTINEDAIDPTVNLTGITAGGREDDPLQITAHSDNPDLILDPQVEYDSPESTGTLHFPPVADAFGTAIITVTLTDGGPDLDLATTGDNESINRSFVVTVNPINDLPTLDALEDQSIQEDGEARVIDLSGITAGGGEIQPLRIDTSSDNPDLIENPDVSYTSDEETGTLTFAPLNDASGTAEITVTVTDGGLDENIDTAGDNASFSQTFTITVNATPTIAALDPLILDEDAGSQTVDLLGITAGAAESQPLQITASSDNTDLIENPDVSYTSDEETGTLTFAPLADQSGTAQITVTVTDGGPDENLDSSSDNGSFSETFEITVNAINDAPALDPLDDLTIDEDAEDQTVDLAGIVAGGGESQPLHVTASSDNTDLVEDPGVTYTSDDETGSLTLAPLANAHGTVHITVTVTDGGLDEDLNTNGDNASFSQTFEITVNAVNDAPTLDELDDRLIEEDSGQQTVDLAGITAGGNESQPLRVTATSDNTDLINNPDVTYTSDETTGSLTFSSQEAQTGTAQITVTVTDGGLDENLDTASDNASFSRTFAVTVESTNRVPQATDDTYSGQENVTLVVDAPGVLQNDSDEDDDELTALLVKAPLHGTLTLFADGAFHFEPDPDFNRTDHFTYRAADTESESESATVSITLATEFPWYNGRMPMDVNDDGSIAPNDAITGVSSLNRDGSRTLPTPREEGQVAPFYDVNRDGSLAPNDVITIVNHLNSATAEGEGRGAQMLQDWALWFPEREVTRKLSALPQAVTYHKPAGATQGPNDSPHTDMPDLPRPQEMLFRLQHTRLSQLNSLQLCDAWFAILAESDWLREDLDINWHHR
ncbi:MAG: FG-GAP-like repeat-containing protein [Planctomycetota bacterium]|nr:FG-GAP-like repeat-containing protein [Planctomycetota bacterium]